MIDRLSRQLQWCSDRQSGLPEPDIRWPEMLEPMPVKSKPRKRFVAFVYVIKAGDYFKIGVARNIERRLDSMQTGCPFDLEVFRVWPSADPYALERRLHFNLREFWVRGEWFQIPESIIAGL